MRGFGEGLFGMGGAYTMYRFISSSSLNWTEIGYCTVFVVGFIRASYALLLELALEGCVAQLTT